MRDIVPLSRREHAFGVLDIGTGDYLIGTVGDEVHDARGRRLQVELQPEHPLVVEESLVLAALAARQMDGALR